LSAVHVSYTVNFDPLWSRLPFLVLGIVGLTLALLRRDRLGRNATLFCAIGCGLLILSAMLAVPQSIYSGVPNDLFIGDVFSTRSIADILGWLRDLLTFLGLVAILIAVFVPRPDAAAPNAEDPATTGDRMPPSAS
jgi:hypothetical protein